MSRNRTCYNVFGFAIGAAYSSQLSTGPSISIEELLDVGSLQDWVVVVGRAEDLSMCSSVLVVEIGMFDLFGSADLQRVRTLLFVWCSSSCAFAVERRLL